MSGRRRDEYESIVTVLRVFAKTGNYAIIDRIANALTARAIEGALYDGLRLINTLMRQAEEKLIDGKKIKVIDFARKDERKFRGLILANEGEMEEEEEGRVKRVEVRYVKAPSVEELPDESQIERFLSEVRKGFEGLSIAKEVAMRALVPDP